MQTEYVCLYLHVHDQTCMTRSEDLLQKQAFLFHIGGPEDHIQDRLGRIHLYSVSHLDGTIFRV